MSILPKAMKLTKTKRKQLGNFAFYTVVGVLIVTWFFTRNVKQAGLGSAAKKLRPPKIRIVYSKKLKTSERPKITRSAEAVEVLRSVWSSQIEAREEFVVLMLDRSNRVLGYQLLSKGGISGTVADIRLIFSVALEALASSIILAHNHPSGNLKPSEADLTLTRKVKEASKVIDIALLDHFILTKEGHYSFADEGDL